MSKTAKLDALRDKISGQVTCISDVKDIDYRKTLLQWRCIQGHRFTSSAHAIQGRLLFHVRTGAEPTSESICPECISLRLEREAAERSAIYLKECIEWGTHSGIRCVSKEVLKAGAPVEWRCTQGHEWPMSLAAAQKWGGEFACPVCNDSTGLQHEPNNIKKTTFGTVAHRLSDEGFHLSTIADVMGRRTYELAYCYERYNPRNGRLDLQEDEMKNVNVHVAALYTRLRSQLAVHTPTLSDVDAIKVAACLVAMKLMDMKATMKEIKEAFGDNYKQIDYWISVIFPRYEKLEEIKTDARVIKHMEELCAKTKHLFIDIENPLSDLEKIKRTDHFRIAVICLLKKHEQSGLVSKADIIKRFKINYKTLGMWTKRINHKLNIGQLNVSEEIEKIQAAIESALLAKAA